MKLKQQRSKKRHTQPTTSKKAEKAFFSSLVLVIVIVVLIVSIVSRYSWYSSYSMYDNDIRYTIYVIRLIISGVLGGKWQQ
jgi:cell division protein FtsL